VIQTFQDQSPRIDDTAWIHPDATVIGDVDLAAGVSVWPQAVLRGDMGRIEIAEDSNIQDGAIAHDTAGMSVTRIGPRVTVGHRAILHGCIAEGDSILGMGCILLDNCVIGEHCIIGAGALVPMGKVIPPRSLVLGSPGKVVREITDQELEWIRYSWTAYKENSLSYGRTDG
jgi:carbonic anhydrase/acetyltransferase-like protein (isoleucine patch superfamily)